MTIFLGLSAFNKKRIGLKKIPPPIPTIPEINPRMEPIVTETNKLSFLIIIFSSSYDLLFINNNTPAIDKTRNNNNSNVSLFIIKVPPKKDRGIDPIKNGINNLRL